MTATLVMGVLSRACGVLGPAPGVAWYLYADSVTAWTQTVLTVETDVQLGHPAKAVKTQYIADCKGRTLLVNALMFLDAQGNVLASLPPEQDAPANVVPGTGGEFILRAVCNKG